MIKLEKSLTITVKGTPTEVIGQFLMLFLAMKRLTNKQLEVVTALVVRYTTFIKSGVVEPYASQLLFSTETRKEIVAELGISAPHLNNTFNALTSKDILAKDGTRYWINPNLVPVKTLNFNFTIDAEPRKINKGSSEEIKSTEERSGGGSVESTGLSEENNAGE